MHDAPTAAPPGWHSYQLINLGVDHHTALAVDFINSSSEPFFLWLAYTAPHHPANTPNRYVNATVYVPPERPNLDEADISDKPFWVSSRPPLSQSTLDSWREERIASQRELLAIDDGVQSVIDSLKAKGQLENTMLIFLSDNGFSWGYHRCRLRLGYFVVPCCIRLSW